MNLEKIHVYFLRVTYHFKLLVTFTPQILQTKKLEIRFINQTIKCTIHVI